MPRDSDSEEEAGNVTNVIILGGTHIQHHNHFAPGRQPFDQIINRVASGALYDTAEVIEPAKCHPGTREAILERLTSRASNFTKGEKTFTWLHGAAGAGKSAIMRSTAERLHQRRQLLASFFFFRSSNDRNSTTRFIPTITYQISMSCKALRFPIQESIEFDPLIFTRSLKAQTQVLLVDPVLELHEGGGFPIRGPQAIVVDGLDECVSQPQRAEVLHALKLLVDNYPTPLHIIVSSRPNDDIRLVFESASSSFQQCTIDEALKLDSDTNEDLRKFFTEKFDEIQATHRMRFYLPLTEDRWPSTKTIWLLVTKASGQFIFAATVIRFVASPSGNPEDRLQIILGSLSPPGVFFEPFKELDAVYMAIFKTIEKQDVKDVKEVLGVFVMAPSVRHHGLMVTHLGLVGRRQCPNANDVETILDLPTGRCHQVLYPLDSLVAVSPEKGTVEIFHKSVLEFLLDERRSGEFFLGLSAIKGLFLKSLIKNDFWYHDPMLRMYMQNGANVAHLLKEPAHSAELVDAIKSIDFPSMASRVLDQPAVIQLEFPQSWWVAWWIACHDFVEAMAESGLPDADRLSNHVLGSFNSALEGRFLFYFRHPDHIWLLYLASRATEQELVEFIDSLCNTAPSSLVEAERKEGLGFLFHRWGITKAQQALHYRRFMQEAVQRAMPDRGVIGGPFKVVTMLSLMVATAIRQSTPSLLLSETPFLGLLLRRESGSSALATLVTKFMDAFPQSVSGYNIVIVEEYRAVRV